MNIEIRLNKDTKEKELYLFGEFQASWNMQVDDKKVILPYAIDAAVKIGEDRKAAEIRRALGQDALASTPESSLQEHDAKLVERIAKELDAYSHNQLIDIAGEIRKGKWK